MAPAVEVLRQRSRRQPQLVPQSGQGGWLELAFRTWVFD